ncbi:MAG: hypothetical protein WCS52_05465 [bacterium]
MKEPIRETEALAEKPVMMKDRLTKQRNRLAQVTTLAILIGAGMTGPAFAAADFSVCNFDGVGNVKAMAETKLTVVTEHATEGKHALKVECGAKDWPGIIVNGFPKDWTGVKYLAFDVFNPGTTSVELCGWVKDDENAGLYTRYGFAGLMADPGRQTIRLWLDKAVKGNAFPLNKKNILAFGVGPMEGQQAITLYCDNFRLEPVMNETLPDVLPILTFDETAPVGKFELEEYPPEKPGKSAYEYTTEHATMGKRALKCTFRANGAGIVISGFSPNWGQHDVLLIDCFNPTDQVIELEGWFRDCLNAPYYSRYNYSGLMVRPGQNTLQIPLSGLLKGEPAQLCREALNRNNIVKFNCYVAERKEDLCLTFGGFRLEKSRMARFEGPQIRKFAFTPNPATAFPGFTAVNYLTAYDPAYGYGWQGLLSSPIACGSYEYPSDLLGNFALGHEFDIDLPNGNYRVTFYAESASFWDLITAYRDRKVVANGKTVVEEKWTGARYYQERMFRHLNTEDLPSDDHWEKYVKPRWPAHTFEVAVTNGKLAIQFDSPSTFTTQSPSGAWPLNCMVVCPAADSAACDEWLAKLEAEQKRLFAQTYTQLPPPVPPHPAQLPAACRGKDYAVFVPDYFKDIYYNSVPEEAELTVKEIALRTTPGQFDAAAIGVFPLKDLGSTTVTVSNLKGTRGKSSGKVIPATAIETRKVRYKIQRRAANFRFVYAIQPRLLDPVNSADIGKNITRSFHLSVHVPEGTAPGVYMGTVRIAPEKSAPTTLPIQLTVLPITLAEDRDFDLALFGTGIEFTGNYPDTAGLSGGNLLRNLRNLREHGFTTTTGPGNAYYANGKLNMDEVESFVKAYHAAGFDGQYFVGYGSGRISGADSTKDLIDAYTKYNQRLEELGRTKLLLHLIDEPDESRCAEAIALAKKYNVVSNLLTTATYTSKDQLIPWYRVSMVNGHDEAFIKKVQAAGNLCWVYNGGINRFHLGFYSAKLKEAGVCGQILWHYQTSEGDTFNDLDGREGEYSMSFPTPDGRLINAVEFERTAQGILEFRYFTTLRKLVAEKKDTKQAKAGQKLIDEILASMTLGNVGNFNGLTDRQACNAKCTEYRNRIIDAILDLQK